LIILYISWLDGNAQLAEQDTAPLLIASFLMIDMTYISMSNIRKNKMISLFCGLLVLDCWYLLLLLSTNAVTQFTFMALSPIIWYASIKFILMFLFQQSGYKFRQSINAILLITCTAAMIGICISRQIYALLYGIHFLSAGSALGLSSFITKSALSLS